MYACRAPSVDVVDFSKTGPPATPSSFRIVALADVPPDAFRARASFAMASRPPKPAPWKTDASADLTRYGERGTASGSRGTRHRDSLAARKQRAREADEAVDPWDTTSSRAFGSRPPSSLASTRDSRLRDEFPPEASAWTTTNGDMQYDPREFRHPDWAPDACPDPIAERHRRRSRIADPAGTGESGVGGWARVPPMRLGGVDPLGGPDRGRSGVEWGVAHHLATTGVARDVEPTVAPQHEGGTLETELAAAAHSGWGLREGPKPWATRGLHPGRRKQSAGGSDVVSGLWATSATSYGGFQRDAFKLDRSARSKAFAETIRAQEEASYRPSHVLSNAAFNGFGLDEEEAAEAKIIAEERERERRRAEGRETPLAPLEAYKLKKELRKMHVQGVHA
jgi:hypothetical protein